MPNLNIPISEELMVAIRVKCASEGLRQKEWVIQVLGEAANENGRDGVRVRGSVEGAKARGFGQAVSGASDKAGSLEQSGAVGRGAQKDRGREGKGKTCEQHGKVMKDFGNAWMCEGPPSHKEFK